METVVIITEEIPLGREKHNKTKQENQPSFKQYDHEALLRI